jgi:rSAM-associated Gly-rich repeat protein
MAPLPRSGLFGFLLLLAALTPSAGLGASSSPAVSDASGAAAAASVDVRLSRITAALRQRQLAPDADSADKADHAEPGAAGSDTKLAWVFGNGPFGGFRNGGWGNGGFRNGGWGNGGWPNVGWRNGWGNGGGWRNGGWFNRW